MRNGPILLLFLSIVFCCSNLNAGIVDTFDTDLEGWVGNPLSEVTWGSTGGNPGGYALFNDGSGNVTLIEAPQNYLGDWSAVGTSGYITFDHKIFNQGLNVVEYLPYSITIFGTAGNAVWEGDRPTGPNDWTTVTASILDGKWTLSSGTLLWEDLLKDVTGFSIRIEAVNNRSGLSEVSGIDNIKTNLVAPVPIPGTALLFSTGLLAALGLRRKIMR